MLAKVQVCIGPAKQNPQVHGGNFVVCSLIKFTVNFWSGMASWSWGGGSVSTSSAVKACGPVKTKTRAGSGGSHL